MKRLAIGLLFPLALLTVGLVAPASVAATGSCNIAQFYVADHSQASNGWYFCWGVNDRDMESEPGQIIGPLDDGAYHSDWDNISYRSGISYARIYDFVWSPSDPTPNAVCVYPGKDYTGNPVTRLSFGTNGAGPISSGFGSVIEPGSFYFTASPVCAAG